MEDVIVTGFILVGQNQELAQNGFNK